MYKYAALGLLALSALSGWDIRAADNQEEQARAREQNAEAALLVEQLGAEEFSVREQPPPG